MYICMYVCIYACIYMYVHVLFLSCVYACGYLCVCMLVHVLNVPNPQLPTFQTTVTIARVMIRAAIVKV